MQPAKKVTTYDASGQENGFLIELYKLGRKTKVYLSASKPGAFKGYHLHRIRAAVYVCIKGSVKIILYKRIEASDNVPGKWVREEHVMDARTPTRLHIPANVATGIETVGDEEAWIVNQPNPAYDPQLKDEQVEYTQEELDNGIVK